MLNLLLLIAIVLSLVWMAGLATANTMGGLIHVFLVLAIVLLVLRIVMGRKPAAL